MKKQFFYVSVFVIVFMNTIVSSTFSSESEYSSPGCVQLSVGYIPQNDSKSCATTSVAMVISYYEKLHHMLLDKETVWKISGTDEVMVHRFGNDMNGLKRVATHYGYSSQYIECLTISDIETFLSLGIPVMLNVRVDIKNQNTHAVLAIGYDRGKKILYINDPACSQNCCLEYSDLETRWSAHLSYPRGKSLRSGFVIYPKT